jgi:hypothetical protein
MAHLPIALPGGAQPARLLETKYVTYQEHWTESTLTLAAFKTSNGVPYLQDTLLKDSITNSQASWTRPRSSSGAAFASESCSTRRDRSSLTNAPG